MGIVKCWLCPQGSTSSLRAIKGIVLHLTNVHKLGAVNSGAIVEVLTREQRQAFDEDRQEER